MDQEARNKYMQASYDNHAFNVTGEQYKAEPSRKEMDTYCQAVREANYHYGKQNGLKQQLKPRIDTSQKQGAPLDYCYLDIKDIRELPHVEQNSGRRKAPPAQSGGGDENKGGFLPPLNQRKNGAARPRTRTVVTSLKLGYNLLEDLQGVEGALEQVMDRPEENLTMLDLSNNRFKEIPSELSRYQNLTVLYLHGNNITKIKQVKKLQNLVNLQKLTLNANAIFYEATETTSRKALKLEETPYYRHQIIYYLRNTQLKTLDNIPITPKDRENALIWFQNFCPTRPNKKRLPDPSTIIRDFLS